MFSAYMIGNIRLNTLRSRSFFFVTQMKLLDKKSKKLNMTEQREIEKFGVGILYPDIHHTLVHHLIKSSNS